MDGRPDVLTTRDIQKEAAAWARMREAGARFAIVTLGLRALTLLAVAALLLAYVGLVSMTPGVFAAAGAAFALALASLYAAQIGHGRALHGRSTDACYWATNGAGLAAGAALALAFALIVERLP